MKITKFDVKNADMALSFITNWVKDALNSNENLVGSFYLESNFGDIEYDISCKRNDLSYSIIETIDRVVECEKNRKNPFGLKTNNISKKTKVLKKKESIINHIISLINDQYYKYQGMFIENMIISFLSDSGVELNCSIDGKKYRIETYD